jgi:O-antigen ligase
MTAGAVLVLATTAAAWLRAETFHGHTPYAAAAGARWAALLALAAGAAVVAGERTRRQSLLEVVSAAVAAVSVVGLVQHLGVVSLPIPVISAPGGTFGNRNLAADAVAVSLPLILSATAGAGGPRVRRALVAAAALALIYLAATRTRGAWLGAAAGLVTMGALARPRLPPRALAAAVAVAVVAVAAALIPGRSNPRDVGDAKRFASGVDVARASFDPSSVALRTRYGLWRRTLAMWRNHPVWGVGPGNWPVVFPRHAEPNASRDGVLTATLSPRQAHNDLLERAAETGVVGVVGLLALVGAVGVTARRRLRAADRDERVVIAGASGALVALLGAGVTGFPLEMPATLALGGIALGLVARAAVDGPSPCPPPSRGEGGTGERGPGAVFIRWWAMVLAPVAVVGAVVHARGELRGSYHLGEAERALRRDGAGRALEALGRARAATPRSFTAHLWASRMELRLGRQAEAVAAAHAALALEPGSPVARAAVAAAFLAAGDRSPAYAHALAALKLLHHHPLALAIAARAAPDEALRASYRRTLRVLAERSSDLDTAATARALEAEIAKEREKESPRR